MKTTLTHLATMARSEALLDPASRIRSLQRDRWIDYPVATAALARLERLIETVPRQRMPCLLIYGDSNIGKTLIISKFVRDHPNVFDNNLGVEPYPIVAMQMPATPDQSRFYRALLATIGAPRHPTASLSVLESITRDLLQRMRPRMLIVDEVHHLLAGSYKEQRAALNLLKYLANDLQLSVVRVGTADAQLALETDAQMTSRFTPMEVPRWRANEDFRRLLAAFERVLPLRRPSDLTERSVVELLLAATGGLLGEIARLLHEAAELAINDASERISLRHLEHVAKQAA